jgi:hypothetical protein
MNTGDAQCKSQRGRDGFLEIGAEKLVLQLLQSFLVFVLVGIRGFFARSPSGVGDGTLGDDSDAAVSGQRGSQVDSFRIRDADKGIPLRNLTFRNRAFRWTGTVCRKEEIA